MTTATAEITAHIQDFIYSVQHGTRHAATLDEVMDGLMPLVERYADTVSSSAAQFYLSMYCPSCDEEPCEECGKTCYTGDFDVLTEDQI